MWVCVGTPWLVGFTGTGTPKRTLLFGGSLRWFMGVCPSQKVGGLLGVISIELGSTGLIQATTTKNRNNNTRQKVGGLLGWCVAWCVRICPRPCLVDVQQCFPNCVDEGEGGAMGPSQNVAVGTQNGTLVSGNTDQTCGPLVV